MNRNFSAAVLGLFALVFFIALPAVAASSTAKPSVRQSGFPEHSGLTADGIATARASGMPSALVTMAPQSSLKLLALATEVGPHASNSTMKLTVSLKLGHPAKLQQFLQQAQYLGSPVYHQWLTPEQAVARFGPTPEQVKAVKGWLTARGVQILDVTPNNLLIHTTATTAVYEHAFGIRINDYELNERSFYSTTDSPKLPRSIAGYVQNVIGLNKGVVMQPRHTGLKPLPGNRETRTVSPRVPTPPPLSSSYYAPIQIATAYDVPDITDASHGAGVTIAILTAQSPDLANNTLSSDFWAAYGLPDHDVTVVEVDGASEPGGMGETQLDMQWSGAWAPGADLLVYVAADASFATFTDMYSQFQTDNAAQVMTTSWGSPELLASRATEEAIFALAAAQGISMFAAAGDHGSSDGVAGTDNACDYPSSSLYISAASGTDLHADINGNWISETASTDTGGAICLLDQPDWQTGPGVPQNGVRNTGDLSLNYGTIWPYLVYVDGPSGVGFYGIGGTSAVAPQLAGMFAIAVGETGDRIGQSNKLIYDTVNAGNYASDFRDITSGSNGAYEAGPNWDHPTGWGTPLATSLISHIGIQGPKGTLTGTVTAAGSDIVLAGAEVVAVASDGTKYGATTLDDGSYSRLLPAGSFSVTARAYGYTSATASVQISDGGTTTEDFALQTAATATLNGKVTDGSGHGYGLYAEIKVSTDGFGQVADVWTDPTDGTYSVDLPTGSTYMLDVAAAFDGYNTADEAVVLTANTSKNFPLAITDTCTAPGYTPVKLGLNQDFNGSTFPPAGWSVSPSPTSSVIWKLSSTDPGNENYTGGTGTAANANSGDAGAAVYDTSLITPPIPVTSLHGTAILTYKANFQVRNDEALDLDISSDGGNTWQTISHWTTSQGALLRVPGVDVKKDIGSYLPASGDFQLRWRYYNVTASWDRYAQIDDAAFAGCALVPGGLVYGQVAQASTGDGIVGATVSDEQGNSTTTVANPADPDFPVGGYVFFVSGGHQVLTVNAGPYFETAEITLNANQILTQNFLIEMPEFTTEPDRFTLDLKVNTPVTQTLTLNNVGQGVGHYQVLEINASPSATTVTAPARTIKGHFTPASMAYAKAQGLLQFPILQRSVGAAAAGDAGSWQAVADFPTAIIDGAAATDQSTGNVYVVGGSPPSDLGYVYNPGTDTWAATAPMSAARAAAAVGFINGKLYVVNGWGGSAAGDPVGELDIYDPQTDGWSVGAPNPSPAGGGSASAVVNGKLFVVGGCSDGSCANPLDTVEVYDPVADKWSSVVDYPNAVAFPMCGALEAKLYCAGGNANPIEHADGYVYDPYNPGAGWTPIANIPVQQGGLWAAGYTSAQGSLLVSGGVTGNGTLVTNGGWSYHPRSNTWTALPNANNFSYRGASACGFYRIGGFDAMGGALASTELLPGYDECGSSVPIPWLTVAPQTGTLAVGASVDVTLTFDAPRELEFTTSNVYLRVAGSPAAAIVPVTVHWEPQQVNLAVSGRVTPTGLVEQGDLLSYDVSIKNQQGDGIGAATEIKLTYQVPDGLAYVAASGDAGCAPASSATIVCDFGIIQAGEGKTVLLAAEVIQDVDTVESTFTVSAREPDINADDDTVTISTDPNAGPTGPTGPGGPEGQKGDSGSGGFGGFGLLFLLGLALAGVYARQRRARSGRPSAALVKRGGSMKVTMTAMLLALFVLPFAATPAIAAQPGANQPSGAQSASTDPAAALPAALRPIFYRSLARDSAAAHQLDEAGCATLARSALKACFDAAGAHFSGPGAPALALHLLAYGRDGNLTTVTSVHPKRDGAQLRYRHDGITEWWRVLPIGFEQGFTLAERPAGAGPLTLTLGASHAAEQHGDGLAWGKLSYGGLVVTDADGKLVPATLTSDGDRILIAVNDAHAVYPLVVDPLVRLVQEVTASDASNNYHFGYAVAASGTTVLIGANGAFVDGHSSQGAAYVFTQSDGKWIETARLVADDGAQFDRFGSAVALSGTTALIGASSAKVNGNYYQGAVYVFTESGGSWTQTAKLVASDGAASNYFGASVALSGDTAIVGAYSATVNGNRSQGAAYVFTESGGSWSQTAKLVASDGAQANYFGRQVALSGATVFVGATRAAVGNNTLQGAVYVFTDSGGAWSQTQKLVASDGTRQSAFGSSIALSGDTALIGASSASVGGITFVGAVYVFDNSGGSWSQTDKFAADDGEQLSGFGGAVALSGSTALVGASQATVNGTDMQGAAYLFTNSGGAWRQTSKFVADDGEEEDGFGNAVALSGTTALVGASSAKMGDNFYQGAAYFYDQRDLDLTVSAPAAVSAGQTFVSQTIVTNSSSAASPAVAVTTTVPVAASFISASASQGTCTEDSGLVICDFGSVDGNAGTATANMTLRAPGNDGADTLKSTASVVKAMPSLTASGITSVVGISMNLAISGNVTPVGPVKEGDDLVYVIDLKNLSVDPDRAATQTRVTYEVPDGLEYTAASGDASCTPSSGATIVCDFGTIQAQTSKFQKLIVQTTQDVDAVASTFTASASEADSDPSDNSVTIATDTNAGPPGPTGPGGPDGPKGESGSGGFGGFGLLFLLGLALAGVYARQRRARSGRQSAALVKRGVSMKVTMTAMLLALFVLPFSFGAVQAFAAQPGANQPSGAQSASTDPAASLPAALRPIFYRALARDSAAAHQLDEAGCATLARSALKACFDADGAHFSGPGAPPLALQLMAYGRAGDMNPIAAVHPEVDGAQLSFRHDGVTEWWRVLPIGFEQGFTLAERPAGAGPLTLTLGASHAAEQHGDGLAWGKLSYDGLVVTDAHGKTVPATLTSDGDRILIAVNDAHAVYPLVVDPLVQLEQEVTASDGAARDRFGFSVAISGSTAVIGADHATINGNFSQGAAYVFSKLNGQWSQVAKLVADDGTRPDAFGSAVAISGSTAVIGAPQATVNGNRLQGAAYVFTQSGGSWQQVAKLVSADGARSYHFGAAVALFGDTAIVGAYSATVNGNRLQGAAYIFTQSGGHWSETAKLTASDGATPDLFGYSVALSGSSAIVSALRATVNGNANQGAAYVFTESGGSWSQVAKLTSNDGDSGDYFGSSVALSGTAALVGAMRATVNGNAFQGAAYVFTETGGNWSQAAKLFADDGAKSDQFGSSVALAGNTAVIGAPLVMVNGNRSQGKAYMFTKSGGSWSLTAEFVAGDGAESDSLGHAVALSDTTALVGAYAKTVNDGGVQGAAYFFDQANLDLTVSAPAAVSAGRIFVSQTIITNSSSAASPGVIATVTVPAAASFVSANASQGTCGEDSGVVRCNFGSINGNAGTATANVTLRAPDNVHATVLDNTASIVGATPPLSARAATTVKLLPVNLKILGNVSPIGPVEAGDNLNFVITVQNLVQDPSAEATETQLVYQVPEGLEYVASDGDASCVPSSEAGTKVYCDFGIVHAGASKLQEISVQATRDADAIDSFFTVSAEEQDLDLSNNSITLSTNPDYGPPGPTGPDGPAGPQGPKGDEGSGGLGFGGLALLALLALSVGAVETGKRRRRRRYD